MVFFENIAEPSKESPREGDESPDGEFHQCLIKGIDCFLGLLLALPLLSLFVETCSLWFH